MFEIGQRYSFRQIIDGAETVSAGKVVRIDGLLIEVEFFELEIVNTISVNFISAKKLDVIDTSDWDEFNSTPPAIGR